ncbi:hypothetical protein [Lacrimispora sphenoides]|jgi:hypothetical protein|uniref:hypothetical protein n=1 Tax=Lacrimispora sphenoides TaxID=29370 RepID=UPI00140E734F|nr:hypothetical protein [Lacrimispora sphenoides]
MKYKKMDVIIRKKQSVSAYANMSKNVEKVEPLTQGFEELNYEGKKKERKL